MRKTGTDGWTGETTCRRSAQGAPLRVAVLERAVRAAWRDLGFRAKAQAAVSR